MDPVTATLAANVMTVLMPYAAMGAQEFVKSAGKEAYEKAKSLLGTLKARWAGDKEAADTLARFEEKPERYQPVLEDVLEEKIAQDRKLAAELAALLEEMGPDLEVIQQMEEGRRVTGLEAEQMSGGRARVRQDIGRGEDVTGARIGRIGPLQ
jgi:predicted component of type VI protein secretion system